MAETRTNLQLEIVGARLMGPAPIEDVWLPLRSEVTALYGKNGAGKSRLLYALADLYAGRPSTGYLVAKVVEARSGDGKAHTHFSVEQRRDRDVLLAQVEPPPSYRPWKGQNLTRWQEQLGDLLWPVCYTLCGVPRWLEVEIDESYEQRLLAELDNVDELPDSVSHDIFEDIEDLGRVEVTPMDETVLVGTILEILAPELVALTPTAYGWDIAPAVLVTGHSRLRGDLEKILRVADEVSAGASLATAAWSCALDADESLLVTLGPLREALLRGDGEAFYNEANLLRHAETIPYRLGGAATPSVLDFTPDTMVVEPLVLRDDHLDVDLLTRRTRDTLYDRASDTQSNLIVDDSTLDPRLLQEMRDTVAQAQELYRGLLVDPPRLDLAIRPPSDWFLDEPFRWIAASAIRSDVVGLPLSQLSEAQRKWALVSIALEQAKTSRRALSAIPTYQCPQGLPLRSRPLVVALDEPDGALHATAQRHTIQGLVDQAVASDAMVIVATHSAEFLRHPSVTPLHVSRDGQGALLLSRLDRPQRERVEDLGLDLSDLLLMYRAVLVVEGAHDMEVLDAVIGRELDNLRIWVLPMRGGRLSATVVESYVLSHFSDAPVILALDNLQAAKIDAFWHDLLAHADDGQSEFDAITKRHFTSRERDEETFVINYCRAAAELGQTRRFRVFGFSKPDIPEYLPVQEIVPGALDWETLRHEFDSQSKYRSFKPWLLAKHGIEVSEPLLRHAAERLDAVPEDFQLLLGVCEGRDQ